MRSQTPLLLTGMLCALLAACHATDDAGLARSNSGVIYAAPAATTPQSTPASTATSTATDTSNMSNDTAPATLNISSATVQSIETVPRGMDQGSGDMQAGTSGTAGTGSSAGAAGNMLYRVTLRLDDGTTRTFVQNTQPAFQIGERVSVQRGVMQRY
ncbi:hypothetical protein [Janthinobacterium sp. 1_2014MBL_MicDiv]|uniref:hypothetical protein n=1 Tax=Janthinobacterium sp. 1_2014MBL_MicDiv TaxID=1644131 RepID=UPI0012EBCE01|nr:hypothetical protein [Janthinobacterium sp. 1_2014MBL_MicDiv]